MFEIGLVFVSDFLFGSFFRELTDAADEKSLQTKVVSGARARLHAEAFQW